MVVASRWVIRKNFIADFIKGAGNRTSYGGYAKGGGHQNLFENNIIFCEYLLRSPGAITIGLSLGGGGTGPQYCRDRRCITEQDDSIIRGNLIASCSDDGIYVNKAAMSRLTHNTLIDTGGISVRYPTSSVEIDGNLVDGKIRSRDEAVIRATDNLDTSTMRLFVGSHPVRDLFPRAEHLDFTGKIPLRAKINDLGGPDLCAAKTAKSDSTALPAQHAYGAFIDFAACLR